MSKADLIALIDETLAVLSRLSPRPATAWQGATLDRLFETLREGHEEGVHAEAEGHIWGIWCTHADLEARVSLDSAIQALGRERFDHAERVLDRVVERWPEWAEGWNKRATLYFLLGRDAESIADIQRTLAIEPRHFGAISGFAQICMRAGESVSALAALDCVLRICPHHRHARDVADTLRTRVGPTLH